MSRLSDKLRKLEDKTEAAWIRVKPKLPRYAALAAAVLYLYGMFLRILAEKHSPGIRRQTSVLFLPPTAWGLLWAPLSCIACSPKKDLACCPADGR